MCLTPSKVGEDFAKQWARENLYRKPTEDELKLLNMFFKVCNEDFQAASRRARRYYEMRGRGAVKQLWHNRRPDDEEILKSCQEAYIIPLKTRSVGGRRLTITRMPAPHCLDQPLAIRALVARWLMLFDLLTMDSDGVTEEVTVIDLDDLQAEHYGNHFHGNYWKNFFKYIMEASPLKFAEIHVVNTHKLKTFSLFMMKMGAYPWKRKVTKIHDSLNAINQIMGLDYFPVEGLPYEYGGKAGSMKDLNDECTKKLLSQIEWLHSEEEKFKNTELVPIHKTHHWDIETIVPKPKRKSYSFIHKENGATELSGNFKCLNFEFD